MQKFLEEETRTSPPTERERLLARFERVLRRMPLNTQVVNSYPLVGIDVVPALPKPSKMAQLMKLLQEANLPEEKERDRVDYWK